MFAVQALLRAAPILAAGACTLVGAHPLTAAAPPEPFSWNLQPWLVALLAGALFGYVRGMRRKAPENDPPPSRMQAGAFVTGWAVLLLALVSPLDALGAWLLSAHAVQHALIVVVAAPLLVLGRPASAWARGLGPGLRRRPTGDPGHGWRQPWAMARSPLGAWMLHAAVLWLWHVPRVFDAALASGTLHAVQHLSFLAAALLYWSSVLGLDMRRRSGPGLAFISLFTTMLHTAVLGALLLFASRPWFIGYLPLTAGLGLDALTDQRLGGVALGLPAAVAYVLAALGVLGRSAASSRPTIGPCPERGSE